MGQSTATLQAPSSLEAELAARISVLEERVERIPKSDALSMVVFSGELDRILASFMLATGAAASGMKVTMFFSFWGIAALKKGGPQAARKSMVERLLGWMLPSSYRHLPLSRLNMGGVGRWLLGREMRRKGAPDLATLIGVAAELGIQIRICEAAMGLLGIRMEELIDYPGASVCGVASFIEGAGESGVTLFI